MLTREQLYAQMNAEFAAIRQHKVNIDKIKADIQLLAGIDILEEGNRVRLKEDWSSEEMSNIKPKWEPFKHFMTPDNAATIISVYACQGKVLYDLKFDKQYRYYDMNKQVPVEVNDRTFTFNKEDVIKI